MEFEGIYCFDMAAVRFAVYPDGPDGPRVVAHISEDTLRDAFGAREAGDGLLRVCELHFDALESAVVARFRSDPRWPLIITFDDLARRRDLAPAYRSGAMAGREPR
jgi:hypothetical protein